MKAAYSASKKKAAAQPCAFGIWSATAASAPLFRPLTRKILRYAPSQPQLHRQARFVHKTPVSTLHLLHFRCLPRWQGQGTFAVWAQRRGKHGCCAALPADREISDLPPDQCARESYDRRAPECSALRTCWRTQRTAMRPLGGDWQRRCRKHRSGECWPALFSVEVTPLRFSAVMNTSTNYGILDGSETNCQSSLRTLFIYNGSSGLICKLTV